MKFKSILFKNISWIFVGNVIHAIFQFLINILVARVLSKSDYGLINYSMSLVALFTAITTLGFNGVITKKFAENEKNAGEYLWSGIIARALVSIPAIIVIQIIGFLQQPENVLLHKVLFFQSLLILFSSGDLVIYWFRFKYNAKLVAFVRIASFGIMALWRIIALIIFKSISAYVFGTAAEIGLMIIILFFIYKKMKQPKLVFNFSIVSDMLKISYPFIFSSILATIYGQADKIMLNSMINAEAVAYYSVSLTLAGAIAIIPIALIEGFRPDIMMFKTKDNEIYKKRLEQLYFLVFWISILYCTFITIFSKYIIVFIYGESYLPAAPSLALIVWYTSFSYFGAINNIYMVAENKIKWIQVTTLVGALLNIALNFLFIPILQVQGAALASLVTQIFTNFLLLFLIKPLRENFYIIIKGILSFNDFFRLFKKFI